MKTGSVVAACTSEMRNGEGVNSVISQAAPTLCSQVPTLEAIEAIQSPRNTEACSRAHNDGAAAGSSDAEEYGVSTAISASLAMIRNWKKLRGLPARNEARMSQGDASNSTSKSRFVRVSNVRNTEPT